jgi:hypothetical protein
MLRDAEDVDATCSPLVLNHGYDRKSGAVPQATAPVPHSFDELRSCVGVPQLERLCIVRPEGTQRRAVSMDERETHRRICPHEN